MATSYRHFLFTISAGDGDRGWATKEIRIEIELEAVLELDQAETAQEPACLLALWHVSRYYVW
jgi:hypothetical protein